MTLAHAVLLLINEFYAKSGTSVSSFVPWKSNVPHILRLIHIALLVLACAHHGSADADSWQVDIWAALLRLLVYLFLTLAQTG